MSSNSVSVRAEQQQQQQRRRGMLIVLEALDRAGKTTTATRLLHALNSSSSSSAAGMRFPDYNTEIGQIILKYLKREIELDKHAVHLLFAANRAECKERILSILHAGQHIVLDRYCYSGIAYSIAKGLDSKWSLQADHQSELPAPDLVLYLNVSPEVAAQRAEYGIDRYEDLEMQRQLRSIYSRLTSSMPSDVWKVVDADQHPDQVFADTWSHVQQALQQHARMANSSSCSELKLDHLF